MHETLLLGSVADGIHWLQGYPKERGEVGGGPERDKQREREKEYASQEGLQVSFLSWLSSLVQ